MALSPSRSAESESSAVKPTSNKEGFYQRNSRYLTLILQDQQSSVPTSDQPSKLSTLFNFWNKAENKTSSNQPCHSPHPLRKHKVSKTFSKNADERSLGMFSLLLLKSRLAKRVTDSQRSEIPVTLIEL